jgi:glycosyltransferase involved in cell wall biosynthesis
MEQRALSIWLITVGEPLPLRGNSARLWRTGLLAQKLVERGHAVTWWTSTVDHFNKRFFVEKAQQYPVQDGFKLQFLHGDLYTRNVSFARWRNHRQIAAQFVEFSKKCASPDVILCSYPPIELSAAAVEYGNAHRIPVLLDICDLWPDEIAAKLPGVLRPMAPFLLFSMYRKAKFAMRNATGLVAISNRYREWSLAHAGRSAGEFDAVFTHGYPQNASASSMEDPAGWLARLGIEKHHRVFWFVGTFVGSIDLATVIEAAKRLTDLKEALFVLSGSGEKDAELREQAAGLSNVRFTGWLDQAQLATLASTAWVGLGPYKKDALMSLPNKIFEYMAYGLPVLLSLPGEAQDIVETADCGRFYRPGSAQDLESAVRLLCRDPARREHMARRAQLIFREKYSAETVYGRMAEHLEASAECRGMRRRAEGGAAPGLCGMTAAR